MTWPRPCSSSSGRKALIPLTTPSTLTSSTQSRPRAASRCAEPPPTPALLNTMSHGAEARRARRRAALDRPRPGATSRGHAEHLGARRAQLGDRLVERRLLDVGEHQARRPPPPAVGAGPTDPAGAAGDHRRLAHAIRPRLPLLRSRLEPRIARRSVGRLSRAGAPGGRPVPGPGR